MILAHKNISQVCRLVEYFSKDCDVFVHIDRKQCVDADLLERLESYGQVKFISRKYDVFWGGTSVLESEMHLLQAAFEQSDADYFHLISGQDYPMRPLSQFLDFFTQNAGKEYLQYVHLPHPRWERNTFRRLQYYFPYDYAGDKEKPRQWVHDQLKLQYKKGLKRPIPDEFDHLYGGSQWFSVSRHAVNVLLDYTEHQPSLYRKVWMTFAPEEFYVATVLVNLLGKDRIVPWNCRFIRWKHENGNSPANLGNEHFHYLLEREYLFARKMEFPCSAQLLESIDRYLLRDSKVSRMVTGGWKYDGFLKYSYNQAFCDFVTKLWHDAGIRTAVDMGCGAGYYVAQWRSRGLSFAGYDANPHTPLLSSLLLPEGDKVCGVADLTEELCAPTLFDLVVCKDVLQFVPKEMLATAVRNLARLSSHFILLSWNTPCNTPTTPETVLSQEQLVAMLRKYGFVLERFMTAQMRVKLTRKDCCLFIKHSHSILL